MRSISINPVITTKNLCGNNNNDKLIIYTCTLVHQSRKINCVHLLTVGELIQLHMYYVYQCFDFQLIIHYNILSR